MIAKPKMAQRARPVRRMPFKRQGKGERLGFLSRTGRGKGRGREGTICGTSQIKIGARLTGSNSFTLCFDLAKPRGLSAIPETTSGN